MRATPEIQDYARRRAVELMEAFPRIEHVHVILDHQRYLGIAEVVIQAKRHVRVEAACSSDNLKASLDAALAKVEKQLRRGREKTIVRKVAVKPKLEREDNT
jgi:ribosomal subunit interface protein